MKRITITFEGVELVPAQMREISNLLGSMGFGTDEILFEDGQRHLVETVEATKQVEERKETMIYADSRRVGE